MRGSDSERMMAEIEAFLRTGEGPPPAPEPRSVVSMPPEGPADPFDGPIDYDRRLSGGGLRFGRLNPFRRGLPLGRPPRPGPGPFGSGGGARRRPGLVGGGASGPSSWFGLGRPGRGGAAASGRGSLQRRYPAERRSGPAGRWDPPAGMYGAPGTSVDPPRWTVLRVLLVVGVLAALLVLPSLWPVHPSGGTTTSAGADRASAAPAAAGYSFLQRNRSGTPVRWNPCQPIYYVTNLAAAPPTAAADLQQAVSQISKATGIMFVDRGSTTTFPGGGSVIDPSGPAGPVVIAWADPAQTSRIDFPAGSTGADALARAEPIAETDQNGGHGVYVTGTVLISSAAGRLPSGFGPGGRGMLFLHELGHLMGLGNVPDAGQVMNEQVLATSTRSLGSGDLAGLKRLGSASGCLNVPATGTFQPSRSS
ncbi:MAG TPA: hypothetical protein VFN68_03900 [Acidimicrobiales bacterium]|nr:hypothetical protein [Acidimicrobiales bacterium]